MCRWRSYFTSGSSAVYLFLYSAFYFYTKLDITKVSLPLSGILLVIQQLLLLLLASEHLGGPERSHH